MQLTTSDDPSWLALHDAFVNAVRLITPKELCFKLNITAQYLSAALNYQQSKGIRLEWLLTVIRMAPIEAVAPILRALADIRGFEVERRKTLTPEEENVATRAILQRVAPGVLELIDRELGKATDAKPEPVKLALGSR